MKYTSRRSRRRGVNQPDKDQKQKAFFSKTQDSPVQHSTKPFFQAKLVVGQPGDKFEIEANKVAGKVVANNIHGSVVQNSAISSVQRYMTNKAFDEKGTNTERIEEDKKGDEVPMQSMEQEQKPEEEVGQQMTEEKKPEEEAGQQMSAEEKPEEEEGQQMTEEKKPEEEVGQQMSAEQQPEEEMGQQMAEEKKPEEEAGQQMSAEQQPEEEVGQQMTEEKKPEEEVDQQMSAEQQPEEEVGQSMENDKKLEEDKSPGQAMHHNSSVQSKNNSGNVEALLSKTKGNGRSLSKDIKRLMEEKFNAKFDKVRIHTGEDAVQLTNLLKAHAFTHGFDIYFNEGKFNPQTSSGLFLLAHELTHVVQQKFR